MQNKQYSCKEIQEELKKIMLDIIGKDTIVCLARPEQDWDRISDDGKTIIYCLSAIPRSCYYYMLLNIDEEKFKKIYHNDLNNRNIWSCDTVITLKQNKYKDSVEWFSRYSTTCGAKGDLYRIFTVNNVYEIYLHQYVNKKITMEVHCSTIEEYTAKQDKIRKSDNLFD